MSDTKHIPVAYLLVHDLLKKNAQAGIINFDTAEHTLNGIIRSKIMRMTIYYDMAHHYKLLRISKNKYGSYIEVLPLKLPCDINNMSSLYHYSGCW